MSTVLVVVAVVLYIVVVVVVVIMLEVSGSCCHCSFSLSSVRLGWVVGLAACLVVGQTTLFTRVVSELNEVSVSEVNTDRSSEPSKLS